MFKSIGKRIAMTAIAVFSFLLLVFSAQNTMAISRIKDDTDLSKINLYQFTLRQDNMEVLNQNAAVVKDVVPANGSWKESTVFSLKVDKNQNSQSFPNTITLRFKNAGIVYGKVVDVYVKVNNVTANLAEKNADYNNSSKTVVPFLTVDENWGTKSIQIMDYIYPNHPTVTHDIYQSYWINANVTAELRYQDGTPCDLKLVMTPSDIDVISNIHGQTLKESFALENATSTIAKIVTNNANNLAEVASGGNITWTPTDPNGTSNDWDEHNKTGLAVRSVNNTMTFSYGTTASCGGLFGIYTEVPAAPPVKTVSTEKVTAKSGQEINYTVNYTAPVPGVDLIGNLDSMKMADTFDERLDFKSLSVVLDGKTLIEGEDYTVDVSGQTVTVTPAAKYLAKGNGGKNYVITYKTVTNSKIEQNGSDIENRAEQILDNVPSYSNTVKTQVLFKKTHEYRSGTLGKELPQSVLDLLPPAQLDIPNGTTVTPDPPKNNI